jgi:hypothetical protein
MAKLFVMFLLLFLVAGEENNSSLRRRLAQPPQLVLTTGDFSDKPLEYDHDPSKAENPRGENESPLGSSKETRSRPSSETTKTFSWSWTIVNETPTSSQRQRKASSTKEKSPLFDHAAAVALLVVSLVLIVVLSALLIHMGCRHHSEKGEDPSLAHTENDMSAHPAENPIISPAEEEAAKPHCLGTSFSFSQAIHASSTMTKANIAAKDTHFSEEEAAKPHYLGVPFSFSQAIHSSTMIAKNPTKDQKSVKEVSKPKHMAIPFSLNQAIHSSSLAKHFPSQKVPAEYPEDLSVVEIEDDQSEISSICSSVLTQNEERETSLECTFTTT